jgi:excisionase family DNA binding protein
MEKENLTISEFAYYQGVSSRTVRRMISKGELAFLKNKARSKYKKTQKYIHYAQLSATARDKFLSDRKLKPTEADEQENDNSGFKDWQKQRADERLALVKEYEQALQSAPARRRTLVKKDLAARHNMSVRGLDRLRRAYREAGYDGLIPAWSCGSRKKIIDDEMAKFIEKSFLVPFGPPLLKIYEDFVKHFSPRGVPLPTYRTVAAWMSSKWTKSQQLLLRDREQWEKTHGLYVARDWSKVGVNEVYVADSKQIDVACLFRGKPVFPWIVAILDAASRKIVGHILVPIPNGLAIGQAAAYAFQQHGIPVTMYMDNGADYQGHYISGEKIRSKIVKPFGDDLDETATRGLFRSLGIELFFAAGYNGREKIIEPAFKIFTYRFRHLPGYRAHNTKLRPKKLAHELKTKSLLTFEQLEAEVDKVINERNARPHSTTKKIPNSFYENFTPKIPSQNLLSFLLMDQHIKKVKNSGVLVEGLFYRNQDLWRLSGELVEIRRDPADIRTAAIIYQGKLFGFASLETPSHYRDAITLDNIKTARRIKRKIGKFRKIVLEHEDIIDDPLHFAVELEAREGIRKRDIRPAPSRKVISLHRKQALAGDVAKGLETARKTAAEGPPQEGASKKNPLLEACVRDEDLLRYFED